MKQLQQFLFCVLIIVVVGIQGVLLVGVGVLLFAPPEKAEVATLASSAVQ